MTQPESDGGQRRRSEHTIAFVWDNFGFMHDEKCEALAQAGLVRVVGIELFAGSDNYGWDNNAATRFHKITLFPGTKADPPGRLVLAWKIVRSCLKSGVDTVMMCGHSIKGIFEATVLLRLLGRKVFILTDSKFDDKPRQLVKEVLKSLYYLPYNGAFLPSTRSKQYMQFLGLRKRPIVLNYYNRTMDDIVSASGSAPAPDGIGFAERDFLCIARLVAKKNHSMLLRAFAAYAAKAASPRRLVLCGSGPLETELRALAGELGIAPLVEFRGWQHQDQVARQLARSLALLLPSVEEQFGIAVIEAMAMGVPPIVAENVGARDLYVRSGVNGFVVESDNPEGLAYFMGLLDRDEALWRRMAIASRGQADRADIRHWVASVHELTLTIPAASAPPQHRDAPPSGA